MLYRETAQDGPCSKPGMSLLGRVLPVVMLAGALAQPACGSSDDNPPQTAEQAVTTAEPEPAKPAMTATIKMAEPTMGPATSVFNGAMGEPQAAGMGAPDPTGPGVDGPTEGGSNGTTEMGADTSEVMGLDSGMNAGLDSGVDGGVDAGPDSAPACTGKPGMHRGRSVQTLMAGGLDRRFIYYAPESLDPNEPAPLLVVAHGFLMNGEQMAQTTRFEEIAEREGFIVVFPDGQGERAEEPGFDGPWNVGEDTCENTLQPLLPLLGVSAVAEGDDQAFVDAMLTFAKEDQCVDEDHVFMTGFSMGGFFSNENGCLRSDVQAIAPHSGGSHALDDCPGDPKPVLVLHFEEDGLIPYDCGLEARDRWLERYGCDAEADPEVRMVNGGICEYFQGCPDDAQVAMCSFHAPMDTSDEVFLGHAWSGGSAEDEVISTFAIPETENASELVWEFFTEYAW